MDNEGYDFENDMAEEEARMLASMYKDVTISIDPETHRKLKVIASIQDYSLDSAVTELLSNKFKNTDIAELVKNYLEIPLTELEDQSKYLKNKNGKRVTVSIVKSIHKKLKIISSARGISLDKVASEMVEEEVNKIDITKLLEESL